MLFARPSERAETARGVNKFTQNDVVVNASSDVTAALRRTHELMQAELSRSQFAQETLGIFLSIIGWCFGLNSDVK